MEWAAEYVTSVLCSCLATHSLMKYRYNVDRRLLPQKKWGVYSYRVAKAEHPLLRDINTRFDVPTRATTPSPTSSSSTPD